MNALTREPCQAVGGAVHELKVRPSEVQRLKGGSFWERSLAIDRSAQGGGAERAPQRSVLESHGPEEAPPGIRKR